MNILGISCHYHDSAAALIQDGVPKALIQEERFTRVKHDASFPYNAINFVLKEGGINESELDYVVFYEKPFLKFERFIISSLSFFPKNWKVFSEGMLSYINNKLWVRSHIQEFTGVDKDRIVFIPHHLSHAASSFLCSPFDEAAIITSDGVGEWTTSTLGFGKDNQIELQKELRFPHSLGLLYSTFTAYLGFKVNDGEYKMMGMSPYGKPNYRDDVLKLVDIKDDGSFRINLNYFSFHSSLTIPYNKKFLDLFGEPRSPKMGHKFTQRHADIAASIQNVTEDILVKQANKVYEMTGSKNLCLAGGVALNSVANYRLIKESPFENIFIQPAATDAGGALGAALYLYYSLLHNKRKYIMEHVFYGAGYNSNYIKNFLETNDIPYEEHSSDETLKVVAEEIVNDKVVGFYQGRSEYGPRALGNRSILADARKKEMLSTVNLKIKFRERFRPFAPSVLDEDSDYYFVIPTDQYPSRFMLFVCPVNRDVRESNLLPAITHVDGTARPQVVSEDTNQRYYKLLEEFKELTGVGCFLNTSFNLSGEPIINSPQDAYNTFTKSKMDLLVLDKFVVRKEQ